MARVQGELVPVAPPLVKHLTVYKKHLRPGHEASSAAEGIAVEANTRLKRKHDAMKKAGEHANAAKVAVVAVDGIVEEQQCPFGERVCP